ncbi:LysR family transcriptional regulator [Glaciimonas sp. PAMC28666]|uniref:LysR family transcriptional regulator n=1 Tax=Glaciimonas sp. PAMC28666 TaxID=2807626 RepID=UPI001965BA8B|nr:LysR family transcriptional regulator [Glaciimonas sp. PAMC28666]QRX84285.1 LysR family transcriptional regulator [Glaciimonas sp. PAMC28666]
MRLNQVDLNLFVVFEAIYAKRNLTRAAEVLCISQPAVSNALLRMRKTFNDQLFVSTPQGMVPTPVAENIVGRVGEALQLLNASVQEAELFLPGSAQKIFRVSMNDLTETLLLPTLGDLLQREAPGIRIESYFSNRRDVSRELATGALDLAIDVPLLIDDTQLRHGPMMRERYVCMLRKGHPLADQPLTLDSYLALGHIHISSRREGLGFVDTALSKLGLSRKIQMRVQHYMVAPPIAMRTDLALTAPVGLVQSHDAIQLELPFTLPALESHLYWHRSADQDQANAWLRSKLLQMMGA